MKSGFENRWCPVVPWERKSLRAALGLMILLGVSMALVPSARAAGFSFGTGFHYQGRLDHDGAPAEGFFDVAFELYDQAQGGTYLGRIDHLGLEVRDGVLAAELDFGHDVRSAGGAWVSVEVRQAGGGAYSKLEPRQKVTGEGAGCTVDEDVTINGGLFVDAPSGQPEIVTACCNDIDDGGSLFINGPLNALLLDSNEIQAQSLGVGSQLLINADGGDVGIGVTSAGAPLHLPAGPDVQPSQGGALVLGSTSGRNVAIDENEIMARNGGSAAILYLNNEGGDVRIGGLLDIGLRRVISNSPGDSATAMCPSGTVILAGGCGGGNDAVQWFGPTNALDGWECGFDGSGSSATAICARMRW